MTVLINKFKIKDILGKVVIIHDSPDDFTTQPSGNSGTKIACGKIEKWYLKCMINKNGKRLLEFINNLFPSIIIFTTYYSQNYYIHIINRHNVWRIYKLCVE